MLIALKTALLRHGIRQYDAARFLGITDTRLSRIICGRLEATDDEKRRLAQLLQIPSEELFVDASPHSGVAK